MAQQRGMKRAVKVLKRGQKQAKLATKARERKAIRAQGHDHAGHDHAGHDHAGHDHAGHDHDHEHKDEK